MMNTQQQAIVLNRDCDAVLIPTAVPIHLPAGSPVLLLQALGGSYTVQINGNLARVEGKDADALGFEKPPEDNRFSTHETATGACNEDEVWEQLKSCFDPEIPVNIVDLGLIYKCDIEQAKDSLGSCITITMTLTAAGCNMGPILVADITNKLYQIENVVEVQVEVVFDPPWEREMMSDTAKLALNMY